MKRAHIIRIETSRQGLVGVLVIDNQIECFTLQPDPTDSDFSIPAGCYQCRRFHGRKYKDTFEIVVPGHTALLFHVLNREGESRGCIGLGEAVGELGGERAILSSGIAFRQFMATMGDDQEFVLVIEDWPGMKEAP